MSLKEKLLKKETEEKQKEEQERDLPIAQRIAKLEDEKKYLLVYKNTLAEKNTAIKSDEISGAVRDYSREKKHSAEKESNTLDALVTEHKGILEKEGIKSKEELVAHTDYANEDEVLAYLKAHGELAELGQFDQLLKKRLLELKIEIPEDEEFTYDVAERALAKKIAYIDTQITEERKKTPEGIRQEGLRLQAEHEKQMDAVAEKLLGQFGEVSIDKFKNGKDGWIVPVIQNSAYAKLSPEEHVLALEALRQKARKDIESQYADQAKENGMATLKNDVERISKYQEGRGAAWNAVQNFQTYYRDVLEKSKKIFEGYESKENRAMLEKIVGRMELRGEGSGRLFGDLDLHEKTLSRLLDMTPLVGDIDIAATAVRMPEETIAYIGRLKKAAEESLAVLERADPVEIETHVKNIPKDPLADGRMLVEGKIAREQIKQKNDTHELKKFFETAQAETDAEKQKFIELADMQVEMRMIPFEADKLIKQEAEANQTIYRPFAGINTFASEIEQNKNEKAKAEHARVLLTSMEAKYGDKLDEPITLDKRSGKVKFKNIKREMDRIFLENSTLEQEKKPFQVLIGNLENAGYNEGKMFSMKRSKESYDLEMQRLSKEIQSRNEGIKKNGEEYGKLQLTEYLEEDAELQNTYSIKVEGTPTTLKAYFEAVAALINASATPTSLPAKEELVKRWNSLGEKEAELKTLLKNPEKS